MSCGGHFALEALSTWVLELELGLGNLFNRFIRGFVRKILDLVLLIICIFLFVFDMFDVDIYSLCFGKIQCCFDIFQMWLYIVKNTVSWRCGMRLYCVAVLWRL